ncbi:MAG: DUF4199 domain-containing protein [Prevotella sp.]|nr:DUF4199 domain-containing protein [Prevotella sp.]
MPTAQDFIQLKAFARQDALVLGGLWMASFALVVMAPQSMMGTLLALSTPVLLGWLLSRFRDVALDGVISFRRGYVYCVYCFLYASLLFAVAQYVYFRFIDGGRFMQMLSESVKLVEQAYQQNGLSTAEFQPMLEQMQSLPPSQWVFMLLMQNLFIGFVLGVPVAAVCARKVKQ